MDAGSNPTEGMDVRLFVFIVCCVGSGLSGELITRPEEYYRARARACVSNCVWSRNLDNQAA